jgi:hypothetical protein
MEALMSITKSYNKHTNTYYAYDTTYVWDEKTKRKVQKKVCIGKYDPETGEVVPNARRGRPSKQMTAAAAMERNISKIPESVSSEISAVIAEINELESSAALLEERLGKLKDRMHSLRISLSGDMLS